MRWLWAGATRDRLRLWSGLVLFAFALTHFLNHALGIWSLDAMTRAQVWRLAVTRSAPGTVVLVGAFAVHAALALAKLGGLRNWRWRRSEIVLAASGFAIPLLLMRHLFAAGVAPREMGIGAAYPDVLRQIWPESMAWQSMLLLVVWLHGCMGLHYSLRGEAWYRRASHIAAALAALVPALALAGVVAAGREAARLADMATSLTTADLANAAARSRGAAAAAYALIAVAVVIPLARLWIFRSPARLSIAYVGGPTVTSAIGPTLLEISRARRVPHLSVCGGKARCSTCRVRIVEGDDLDPPSEAELRLLRRIAAPPDVRLSCQLRPRASMTVARLLKPASHHAAHGADVAGVMGEAAVLFVDIRGFTRLSQSKLAYDVVHILNSFFAGVGRSIESAGGRVDKYIGDGVMAVFEHAEGLPRAARAAIEAVIAIDRELANVNRQLADEIEAPIRLAMGLHCGRLVMGRIGWGAAALPTVIGPAVNVASRLESLAKARNLELALSRECAIAAGLPIAALIVKFVEIRGVEDPFPVALVGRVADLARTPAA
jgi:adenylate cyclase